MKYNIKSIQETEKPIKYLMFWGHQVSKDGSITKSCFSQWWQSNFLVNGINYKAHH